MIRMQNAQVAIITHDQARGCHGAGALGDDPADSAGRDATGREAVVPTSSPTNTTPGALSAAATPLSGASLLARVSAAASAIRPCRAVSLV
ncbi:hypothetical protein GCM10009819_32070 [Agromyces tropicus]|uniref:Uncharacterized protein n=1 Tax=Agromyces tropicus TaxID=555371 RepID=A0ABP5GE93_9MICO